MTLFPHRNDIQEAFSYCLHLGDHTSSTCRIDGCTEARKYFVLNEGWCTQCERRLDSQQATPSKTPDIMAAYWAQRASIPEYQRRSFWGPSYFTAVTKTQKPTQDWKTTWKQDAAWFLQVAARGWHVGIRACGGSGISWIGEDKTEDVVNTLAALHLGQ